MNRFGLFHNEESTYAVPLESMSKILQGGTIYRLPLGGEDCLPVLVMADRVVPVTEPENSEKWHCAGADCYFVIIDSEYGLLALPSDVPGRITAKGECVPRETDDAPWVVGRYRFQDFVYSILNVDCLAMAMAERYGSRMVPQG